MVRTIPKLVMAAVVVASLAGCRDDPNPCDSTTYLSGSDCLPYMDAALPGPDAAAPSDLVAASDGVEPALDAEISEAGATVASKLGQPCSDTATHAECQGADTNYCAKEPNKPAYCTKSGCVSDTDCPTGWTCFDLAKTVGITGYPAMCTMPTI